ncbi:MAG: response regulator [Magnetococcales bacterium]|nr:response regulator [Magnetococcales bacterium]
MTIKSTYRIGSLFAVVVMLTIGLILLGATERIGRMSQLGIAAGEIVKSAAELEHLTHTYLMHHESRAKTQWYARHTTLKNLFRQIPPVPEEAQVLGRIQNHHKSLLQLFGPLTTLHDLRLTHGGIGQDSLQQEQENRLTGQLLTNLEAMLTDAFRLDHRMHANIREAQQLANWIALGSLLTLTGVVVLFSFLGRKVSRAMGELCQGVEIIGQGGLDHQIPVLARDEIGQVAQAFNQMATRLKSMTVSREELAREMDQRRLVERALRRERDLAQKYLDVAEVMLLVLDAQGQVVMINRKGARVLGISEQALVGRSWFEERIPERDREHRRLLFSRRLKGEGDLASYVVNPVLTNRGEERTIAWRHIVLRDEEERIIGTLSSGEDITERLRDDAALRVAKKEAEAANHAKSDFLATMSHEIRTPMNGILGLVQLLERSDLNDDQLSHVSQITQCGKSLLSLLEDILDLSKIEAGMSELALDWFDIRQLVQETAGLAAHQAQAKGLLLEAEVSEEVPEHLKGDDNRLRQILNNLLSNGIKFTQSGAVTLRVELLDDQMDEKGRIALVFRVRDTGSGIPEGVRPKLFQPFTQRDVTTARKFGGTGLGLAISKHLVELMDGDISVENPPGPGSVFRFSARLETGTPPSPEAEEAPENLTRENLSVLLVEDEPVNQLVASGLLTHESHQVTLASRGDEALIQLQKKKFDLILMDLHMPVMDGLETTRRIMKMIGEGEMADTPIVGLTANVLKETLARCRELGMVEVVAKPFEVEALNRVLQRIVIRPPGNQAAGKA